MDAPHQTDDRSVTRLAESEAADSIRGRRELVPCNLCGGTRFVVRYRGLPDRRHHLSDNHQVLECRECGLGQTNPRMDRDSTARAYPPSFGSFTRAEARGGAVAKFREAARMVYEIRWGQSRPTTSAPAGGRALDLGAGTGETLDALRRAGWEVWGVEPDERAAELAADRTRLTEERVIVATAEAADFARDSFDLVVASHVVEHLHDPKEVLAKVHRWLDSDGRLILRCPNFGSLERLLFCRWWFGLDLPRHLYHFTPKTLQRMLEEVGFEVVRSRPQLQGVTLSGSVQHGADAFRGGRADFTLNRSVYRAFFPLGTALAVAGWWSCLDVEARPVR